jgi:acyl-CoA thioester hydrolase
MRWAMNNTVARFLEQARISWFDSVGSDYRTQTEAAILGSITCRFVLPIVYPADVEVTLVAGAARRSTFILHSEIRDGRSPQRVYARAEATMVWIDLKDGKSRPLPEWVRVLLSAT